MRQIAGKIVAVRTLAASMRAPKTGIIVVVVVVVVVAVLTLTL